MGIVVLGAVFVDIKGYPQDVYIPGGRNAGRIEQVPGGVSRNVVEDIANVELRPTFVSLVDDTGLGEDVVRQLRNHKVNTDYMLRTPDGMGTWLAVFNNDGDVCAAISKRPDLRPLIALLDEKGDEIFRDADSIALELDMDKEIVKRVFAYAQKYHKSVYAVVSNMTIAVERRDFLQQTDCFVCNRQEAGILFVRGLRGQDRRADAADSSAEGEEREHPPHDCDARRGRRGLCDGGRRERLLPGAARPCTQTRPARATHSSPGITIGLTYGKGMQDAAPIGTRLAAATICTLENVCPRFMPGEFGLEVPVTD